MLDMLSMKIFFQILFVWQESDWFLALTSQKKLQKQQIKTAPFLHRHTTQIKIQHDMGSISGPRGKGTQIFYGTIKLV